MELVRPWRGASCRCWNDDFWLETLAIFSSYRTPQILTNEIHTLVVKIPDGTLTSCWQLPWNDPLLSGWPGEFPHGLKWHPRSPRLPSKRLVSVGLDLRWTMESDLLGIGPSTLGTMMLPVAVERSKSPPLLVTEQSSAVLAGPSWMTGTRTRRSLL